MDYALKNSAVNPTVLRVIRVLRIATMLRLFKAARGMQSLIATVLRSIPQVANMAALLFLIFFIFSCAAVEIFGKIGCSEMFPCVGIDSKHSNFENFGMAFMTLFRIMTGDNGNGILQDALRVPPYCDDTVECEEMCCANVYVAPVFFVLFTVITEFVLLNVVVAVLLTALEEAAAQDRKEAEDALAAEMGLTYAAGGERTEGGATAQEDLENGILPDCLAGCRSATGGLHWKGHHPRCPNAARLDGHYSKARAVEVSRSRRLSTADIVREASRHPSPRDDVETKAASRKPSRNTSRRPSFHMTRQPSRTPSSLKADDPSKTTGQET